MNEEKKVYETMIDAFLHMEEENLEGKTLKEILMTWVEWVDARYKVAYSPNLLYAILDCDKGDIISTVNADEPNAKAKAREICASLNEACPREYERPIQDNKVDIEEISEAYLNMDDESFIDFLLGYGKEE